MDAERYKDQLREAKYVITKLEFKAEKLADRLEVLRDELNQVRRQLPDGLYILNDFFQSSPISTLIYTYMGFASHSHRWGG